MLNDNQKLDNNLLGITMTDDSLSMLRYYKRHIIALKNMLNAIDPESSGLDTLVTVQDYLIERIVLTEKRLAQQQMRRKELKSLLGQRSTNKQHSSRLKREIARCSERIDGYKFLLFVWRCFGDGIAFKYVSKWNLKRLFYAHDSADMKQDPGHLNGKDGLKVERKLMLEAISHGVPVVLCDLTNTIRHGDVCLLGASDPYVIEVKSSKNRNKRVERQILAIETIHQYLRNDEGPVGGVPNMQRKALSVLDKHHNQYINQVADEAVDGRWAKVSPEEGLYYFAFATGGAHPPYEELFEGIDEPFVFLLNQAKTDKSWGNYYPFTLSLIEPKTLYGFLAGAIYLIVVISMKSLKERASKVGFGLSVVMSDNVGFEVLNLASNFNKDVPYIVSEHFAGRLAFEFLSLDWFVENERIMIDDLEQNMIQESVNS